jgi:DNA repair protein RecO (recombination protein O)
MPSQSSEAFILRTTRYGDNDLIASLFTREFGKVTVMAKGARSSRRRFGGGAMEPFVVFQAQWQADPRRELAVLTQTARPLAFSGLMADLDSLAAGWRVIELVQSFKQPWQPEPELFELALQCFRRLDQGFDPAHRLWFEASLLLLEGLGDARMQALAERFGTLPAAGDWRNVEEWLDRQLLFHLGHGLKTSGYDRKLEV